MRVKLKTYRSQDIKHNICRFRQRKPTCDQGVFLSVPNADLIEGYHDDDNAEERMQVVLQWAASESRFGLELVDDVAKKNLNDV